MFHAALFGGADLRRQRDPTKGEMGLGSHVVTLEGVDSLGYGVKTYFCYFC